MKRIAYYFIIWWKMSRNAFLVVLARKSLFFLFFLGKVLRFVFFLAFLFFLVKGTKTLAGYEINQVIFFFLTFSLIDIVSQFLFREVYRFRWQVVSGDFDLTLVKPASPLFRSLMGGADIIDFVTIPPLMIGLYLVGRSLGPSPVEVVYYLLLLVNGLLIAAAFHIAVLSLGIITLEIDHTVMIFRDLTNLGRLPLEVYKQPLRNLITFLIPIGIMIAVPAKSLMGLVSPLGVAGAMTLGGISFLAAIKFWGLALKKYTSASS